jgi:hypothetical protein
MHYYISSKPDVPHDLEHAGYLCSLMEGNESAKQTALLGKKKVSVLLAQAIYFAHSTP